MTVTVAVPKVAELVAVNVSWLVPVVDVGLKDAVTPVGSPEAVRLTLPAKPPASVTETTAEPEAPRKTESADGAVVSQNPGTRVPANELIML